jgi:hypothetical protein
MNVAARLALVAVLVGSCASQVRPEATDTVPTPGAGLTGTPAVVVRTSTPSASESRSPVAPAFDQDFGSDFPAQPPPGTPVAIDDAWLSADQRTLTVSIVGAVPFVDPDPCSEAYVPWVGYRGTELDVTVIDVHRPHLASFPPDVICALVAHASWFHLALNAPFTGTNVHDLDGHDLVVGRPTGLAVAGTLPLGWSLQRWLAWVPRTPGSWYEIYAADDRLMPDGAIQLGGPGQLLLYQRAGLSADWSDIGANDFHAPDATQMQVTIGAANATVWITTHDNLFVTWTLNGQSLAMLGNAADMTAADLVRYADSVAVPAS